MNKLITIAFGVACATALALSASAKTYYWMGAAAGGNEPLFFNTPANGTIGWAASPDATKTIAHIPSAGNDYVILGIARWDAQGSKWNFPGETLTIAGKLAFKTGGSGDLIHTTKRVIAAGGTIQAMSSPVKEVLEAEFEIPAGQTLTVMQQGTGDRSITLGNNSKNNRLLGSGTLNINATSGSSASCVTIALDGSEFTGELTSSGEGPTSATISVLKEFAGTVGGVPAGPSVRFYYGTNLTERGIRVTTTLIPESLKTKLTFFSPTVDFTAENFPLMTFPEGTSVNTNDFTVYHSTSATGAGTKFNQLGIQVNEDNSMTLMANFTGKSAEVNSWRILPSITRNSWIEREDDDGEGVLTQPEAVYGQSYIERTINGEPWNGVMPTAPGEYTVNWTIPATGEYTGLFAELSFKITPYVDPILSSLRVFRKGGTYWMGVGSLQAAANRAAAAGGGIIEVNTNYLYCGSNSEFKGDVILRACTDPRVTAREFIVDLHSVNVDMNFKLSTDGTSLTVSNIVFTSDNDLAASGLFRIVAKNCSLRFGENAEFRLATSGSYGVVDCNTDSPTVCLEGLVVTNQNIARTLVNVGAANARVVVGKGTRICNNQSVSLNVARADSTVDLFGGVLTGNTVSEALVKSAGPINVKGSPVVWNNKTSAGAQANVKPADATKINLVGDLEEGACVGVTCGGKGGDQFGVWTDGEAKKGFVCDAKPNLLTRIKNGLLLWSTPGMLISIF